MGEAVSPLRSFSALWLSRSRAGQCFGVGDFDATRAAMLAAEVEFTGAIQPADGVSWQHFRCPDGTVAEITGPGRPRPAAELALPERHPGGR
jgi:hypothetical protein